MKKKVGIAILGILTYFIISVSFSLVTGKSFVTESIAYISKVIGG
jgi:hypothetical protein